MHRTKGTAVTDEGPPEHVIPPTRLAYTVGDAANTLSLSRSRIYELVAAGEIAVCKIGKRTVIPGSELIAFLDRHRVARWTGGPAAFPTPRRLSVGGRPAAG